MTSKTLILTVGLPRSGKSTWALEQVHPIVNPDSVRMALYGTSFIPDAEKMVWTITYYMVEALFLAGHTTVILDATNATKKIRDEWVSKKWRRKFVVFNTSKEDCINRAKNSGREDLIPIIQKMNEQFENVD